MCKEKFFKCLITTFKIIVMLMIFLQYLKIVIAIAVQNIQKVTYNI